MQRYLYNNKVKNMTIHSDSPHFNQTGFDSTILPKITRQPGDPVIIATNIDRLDLLANEFYGDARNWWIIADANNLGKGTLSVPPGLQLRIPREFGNMIELLDLEIEER